MLIAPVRAIVSIHDLLVLRMIFWELESPHLKALQAGLDFASAICSLKFHAEVVNVYWIWTGALIGQIA